MAALCFAKTRFTSRSLAASALVALAACGDAAPPAETPEADPAEREQVDAAPRPLEGTLAWALAGDWRDEATRSRDPALRPVEVLEFFGVAPGATVLHAWPDGYYAQILPAYLEANGGSYVAATSPALQASVAASACAAAWTLDPEGAGCPVTFVRLDARSGALAEPGSVDAALAVRTVHAWMALGMAEKAFADLFDALRPGGVLGVIEARAPAVGPQDPGAPTGYVQESYVRLLAEEAGFAFVEASALGANPDDDADHPFGVWTLAPHRRTAPLWAEDDPDFDRAAFDAVGEPDRMALLFRRPRT